VPDQTVKRNIGRPRKDGLPAGSREAVAADAAKAAAKQSRPAPSPPRPEGPPRSLPPSHNTSHAARPGPFVICPEHYPGGWPKGATGVSCNHGIWARPWVP